MIFVLAVLALIIPCIAGLRLHNAGGFFEGLEELQKHRKFQCSIYDDNCCPYLKS